MNVKIEQEFFNVFPNARIGIIVAHGVSNHDTAQENYQALLNDASQKALKHISATEWSDNAVIAKWRGAYQQFKTKKGARSSIEALLKRVQTGKGVNSISPLVDVYNSISLEFGVPCGGEDMDAIEGDMRLTIAKGDEEFITYGSDKSEPPYAGEIIYKDDAGAICRCWNWRESVRTMLTDTTTNAIFVIEDTDADNENFNLALNTLKERLSFYVKGDYSVAVLDATHSVLELS